MTGVETATLVKLLAVGARPAAERLKRRESVVAVLRRLHLAPESPPADFEGVYTYAIVEFCYGKPEPVVRLFRYEYVRAAFRKAFESGDEAYLRREIDEILQWNEETGELGRIDYNLALELAGFRVVFDELVDRTRSAAQTRLERRVGDIQQAMTDMAQLLGRMTTPEEIVRYATRDAPPAVQLAGQLREWFAAVEYRITAEVSAGPDEFVWLVRVPARRGYDTVVVRGVGGELSAPDIARMHELRVAHSATEAWAVAPQRISPAARAAATDAVFCYTFDELIDERADFSPYLEWLEAEVRARRLEERYVPLSCAKEEVDDRTRQVAATSIYPWTEGGLDGCAGRWLDDDSKEHLSVLGEFGTGKSWFCLHFAWTLAQQWRAARDAGRKRPRLPLVVPLRDYAKAVSVESLFSEFFFRKHEILPDGYRVFETLNRLGRLLLIFDGFDEMAARVDRQAMINNFWELARAVVPGSKVLLTCRTEHFPEAREGRSVLGARLAASTAALTGEPPQFEVVELRPFDDEQIGRLLSRLTDARTRDVVVAHPGLMDLMRRPVMSELTLAALPTIARGARVDLARVYLYAVRQKLDADIRAERTFTSRADKVFFLCELSWHMLAESVMTINYREIPDRIRASFGPVVREQRDLDHWHYDMMGQTLLVRDADGNYSPAHRSLLEFFAAYKLVASLGVLDPDFLPLMDGDVARLAQPEAPAMFRFSRALADLAAPMVAGGTLPRLISLLAANRDDVAGANLVELIGAVDPAALAGACLDGAALVAADVGARGMSLAGSSLRHASLAGARLDDVALTGADLTGADLTGAEGVGHAGDAVAYFCEETGAERYLLTRRDEIFRRGPDGPVRVYSTTDRVLRVRAFRDGRLLIMPDGDLRGCVVLDPRTGECTEEHTGVRWAEAVDIGGRDFLVLERAGREEVTLDFLDHPGGRPAGTCTLPYPEISHGPDGRGRMIAYAYRPARAEAPWRGALFEFRLSATGTPEPVQRHDVLLDETTELYGPHRPGTLTLMRIGMDGATALDLADLDDGSVRTVHIPLDFWTSRWRWGRRLRPFVVNERGSHAAVLDGAGTRISVVALGDPGRPVWTVGGVPDFTDYTIPPGTDQLVVADAYGRILTYHLITGDLLDEVPWASVVRGARFGGVAGVEAGVLAVLGRCGASA
ncbi:NACHT domain-containing protein [Actinoplanes sp. RD1]|uniref:NACHT domain-containing protein n=1 Tax=Actinoplanes sp. RD1 TaxID=3064538 RepID=UPI0027403FE7|nr:NACHT domain-containing protein [Actinoplanes sp. RD1]